MLRGKGKKKKKDKRGSTSPLSRIGTALFPRAMFAAVPKSPVPASPPAEKKRSPFATALLTASLGGRMIGSPIRGGGSSGGGDTLGATRPSSGQASPLPLNESMANSSMYDYEDGDTTTASSDQDFEDPPSDPAYETVNMRNFPAAAAAAAGTNSSKRFTYSDRERMNTPPLDSDTGSLVSDKEGKEEKNQAKFDEAKEIVYAKPNKMLKKKARNEQPAASGAASSEEEDLTVVSSIAEEEEQLRQQSLGLMNPPPPPWEKNKHKNHQPVLEAGDLTYEPVENPKTQQKLAAGKHSKHTPRNDSEDFYNHLTPRVLDLSDKERLVEHNKSLKIALDTMATEKQALASQLLQQQQHQDDALRMELRRQMKLTETLDSEKERVMAANRQLQDENNSLRKLVDSIHERGGDLSSQPNKLRDLQDDNDVLKNTVHRLNVELSRYQAKYKPPDKGGPPGLPARGPTPLWLVDSHYLAPLFLAYDDRLQEKEELLQAYEEEMEHFKVRTQEVIRENQQLHLKLGHSTGDVGAAHVSVQDWHQLQEQAKLVLEENQVLMEQLNLLQTQRGQQQRAQAQEAAQLHQSLAHSQAQGNRLQAELAEARSKCSALKQKLHQTLAEGENMIPIQDHIHSISDYQRKMEEIQDKSMVELEDTSARIASIDTERKRLATQSADMKAQKQRMENDMLTLKQSLRRADGEVASLEQTVGNMQDNENRLKRALTQLTEAARRTTNERDSYCQEAQKQAIAKKKAMGKVTERNKVIEALEAKLKEFSRKTSAEVERAFTRLEEEGSNHESHRREYQKEIRHLQILLQNKQAQCDELANSKRKVESDLETVWKSATAENQRMKDQLYQAIAGKSPSLSNGYGYDYDNSQSEI